MKQWIQMVLVVAVAVAGGACAGDRAPKEELRGAPGTAGTSGTADLNGGDRDFIAETLAAGDAEVELGRLAQDKATNPDVREFGAMMVRDHSKAGDELKQVARSHNLMTPPHADEEHAELRERLTKMSGQDFDRAYMNAMVDDHQKTVERLQDKAEGASSDQLKQWASKTLPVVKQHLEKAKQIQQNLGR